MRRIDRWAHGGDTSAEQVNVYRIDMTARNAQFVERHTVGYANRTSLGRYPS
ncbi:MAG: hypothetical protein O3A89_12265 [Actinomycetota bacterium]|nr:hypothetical protein [Actinomycetota bacterium]MDA3016327.1 hypothetical protein [Actinomycetota bacterium]